MQAVICGGSRASFHCFNTNDHSPHMLNNITCCISCGNYPSKVLPSRPQQPLPSNSSQFVAGSSFLFRETKNLEVLFTLHFSLYSTACFLGLNHMFWLRLVTFWTLPEIIKCCWTPTNIPKCVCDTNSFDFPSPNPACVVMVFDTSASQHTRTDKLESTTWSVILKQSQKEL